MDLRLIGWNDIISHLRKVIMSFLSPLEGIPNKTSLVGQMLLGYELDMETFYMNLKCELLYEN